MDVTPEWMRAALEENQKERKALKSKLVHVSAQLATIEMERNGLREKLGETQKELIVLRERVELYRLVMRLLHIDLDALGAIRVRRG